MAAARTPAAGGAKSRMAGNTLTTNESVEARNQLLGQVQDRVLWLAVNMVHHANQVRPNPDGLKVGGHQASSSSVVTLLTSLYFDFMRRGDKIAIKPHASPVYHAIQYLLGNLEPQYLPRLRDLHGLQAYPSRTKDPDGVDYTTGSVGLGAVAPNFDAWVGNYLESRFEAGHHSKARYISLVGDAELDEGSVWEAIAEPAFEDLGNLLWVVDLNRQSLDRVIPGIRVTVWRQMFAASGWRVVDAKFGKRLQSAFAQPNGELLRQAIDQMPNELYQRLLRVSPQALREWLPTASQYPQDLARFIDQWDDEQLHGLIKNLGGHDFDSLREAFQEADGGEGPCVVFAYTLKGWMLPFVGDPQNHSVILSSQQMEQLREELGVPEDSPWERFAPDTPAGKLCQAVGLELAKPTRVGTGQEVEIPASLARPHQGRSSTQQTFGLVLTEIARSIPALAERIVTVAPDVASSTGLGGWINKVGVWARSEGHPMPEDIVRALRWEESPDGQHLQLGISENNLFLALGQLGLSWEAHGQLLFPIGTIYDPFVRRGLDALFYSQYSGGKFIFVGTPSGVSLAPEGGMHQSVVTPSIGAELPDTAYYEPCFGQELEWIMLHALNQVRLRKESAYLRLTTTRIDQGLFPIPPNAEEAERMRRQVVQGCYRLVHRGDDPDYQPGNIVHIFACGAMVPNAMEASNLLQEQGVLANVFNVTGPGPLYRRFQASIASTEQGRFLESMLSTEERTAPIVTVVDGHPRSLAWLGGALGASVIPLGVADFGQSGTQSQLYREHGIDKAGITSACFQALGI